MANIFEEYEEMQKSQGGQPPTPQPNIMQEYEQMKQTSNQPTETMQNGLPFGGEVKDKWQALKSGLAGAGKAATNLPINLAQLGAKGIDYLTDKVGVDPTNYEQNVNDFKKNVIDSYYDPIKAKSPIAGEAGNILGSVGSSMVLPLKAAGVLGTAAQSGVAGYLTSDPSLSPDDKLLNSGIAAATGGAISGGVKLAKLTSPVWQSIKLAFKNPEALANKATERTLQSIYKEANGSVSQIVKQAQDTKNLNYKMRDALADSEGAMVNKVNLKQTLDLFKQDVKSGATSDTIQAIKEGERLLGKSPSPISYTKASQLLDDLKANISSAYRKGDGALVNKLNPIKDALIKDINEGTGSEAIKLANTKASDFYKEVYTPVKEVGKAYKKATTNNGLNMNSYAAKLFKSSIQDKPPGETVSKISSLADALETTTALTKMRKLPGMLVGGLGVGASYFASPAVGAAIIGMQKLPYIYSASKLLNNPNTSALLANRARILEKGNKELLKRIDKRLITEFYRNIGVAVSSQEKEETNKEKEVY